MVGIESEFLHAENPEEARLMVLGRKGFLPVEGGGAPAPSPAAVRIPLLRTGSPIRRSDCAF